MVIRFHLHLQSTVRTPGESVGLYRLLHTVVMFKIGNFLNFLVILFCTWKNTTNENASNLWISKLDCQKEWRNTSLCLWDERTEKDSLDANGQQIKRMSGFLIKLEWRRNCYTLSKQYSEETRKLPGERDNARHSARCTQVRKTMHGLDW